LNKKKITLHFVSHRKNVLRATTFGALTQAESTIKTYEEFEIDWDYLKSKNSEILGLLRSVAGNALSDECPDLLDTMTELGGDLFRELVPPSLREKLDGCSGGNLLLSIDANLVGLPWELLHDGRGFLCRRYDMGRIVSRPPSARKHERRRMKSRVKLLSVVDPEGDLPGAFEEGIRIRDVLLARKDVCEPVLFAKKVNASDLADGLRRSDVFHFAGHIGRDDDGAFLRLSDGKYSSTRIGQLAGRYPFPSMVFLNGCRSSDGSSHMFSMDEGQERAFDLASGFLVSGARHFLGTLWDIRDQVAARAGVSFFKALFSGMTTGSALSGAREDLVSAYGEPSMTWAGYVLYGDPGFSLVGAPGFADELCRQMDEADDRQKEYFTALESDHPEERFFASVALYQMGDRSSRGIIDEGIQILFDLLRSPSVESRQRGEKIVRILVGSDLGYKADGDPETRSGALEVFGRWMKSEEGFWKP